MHCIASLRIGGVETMVLDTLDHFRRCGARHEHILCAFRGGEFERTRVAELSEAGVPCHVLRRSSRYSFEFCRELRRLVDRVQPDIIQAYNPTAALWVRVMLGRKRDPRIVVHCGSVSGTGPRWRWIERLLLPRSHAFVFCSHSVRAVWERRLSIKCPRRVIHNGVPIEEVAAVDTIDRLPPSPFVLLAICRMAAIKDLRTQVRALKILHDRGQSDVRLVLVGDGPARAETEDCVREFGLERAVSFEGFQDDPRRYHHRAHVYLCTSYSEGLSVSLVQAMADGMVCVAGCVGGCSETIEDGVSGFLVPCTEPLPRALKGVLPQGQTIPSTVYDHTTGELRPPLGVDPVVLADRIADIRLRFDEMDGLREAARRRIVEHFNIASYCVRHEELYDQLVGGGHSRR